jgi:hypothetical protein
LLGVDCGIYKSSYSISNGGVYPLHHSPLSPPIPGIVSTGNIFPFTYMYTQYLYYFTLPDPFISSSPLLLVSTPPEKTCSTLLFTNFINKKK